MHRLARFALARPRAALTTWVIATVALAALGTGVEGRLSTSSLRVDGSESARARTLLASHFGGTAAVPVLLQGPKADVDSQGKALARTLDRQRGVSVASPWGGSDRTASLRPNPRTALIVLSLSGSPAVIDRTTASVQDVVHSYTRAPVSARVTGLPVLARAGEQASLHGVHRAELIALPLLLLVLLLVFRSVLAAAIPVIFGAATIASGYGALYLLTSVLEIDSFAVALGSMMGLALAVDYSLLMVSRYREERARRRRPSGGRAAVEITTLSAGRTVVVAGAAIIVAMVVAATLSSGASILSAAVGVSAVALLSVVSASVALPAVLSLFGERLDRHSAPARTGTGGFAARLAARALRRPIVSAAVATGALLLLALPALSLNTGAPGPESLPANSQARQDFAAVDKAMGPGWGTSFELVAVAPRDTMTTPARLAALERFQRHIAKDPEVAAVIGPGSIAPRAARLRKAGRDAVAQQKQLPGRARGIKKLNQNVTSARSGVDSLHSALAGASGAAAKVNAGTQGVAGGVGSLRNGIHGAASSAQSLAQKLAGAGSGTKALASSAAAARGSASAIKNGLGAIYSGFSQVSSSAHGLQQRIGDRAGTVGSAAQTIRNQKSAALSAIAQAERSLPSDSSSLAARAALQKARGALNSSDPAASLDAAVHSLGDDAASAGSLAGSLPSSDVARLEQAARTLASGLGQLSGKAQSLGGGVAGLAGGTSAILNQLNQLSAGTSKLDQGIAGLRNGISGLQAGVRSGEQQSSALAAGLGDARSAAQGLSGSAKPAAGTNAARPSFFNSGYFLLAALQSSGTGPFGVNIDRGGQAARVLIVPRHGVNDARTRALYTRLMASAAHLGVTTGTQAAIGGPAALLADYDQRAGESLPLIVLVLAAVTALLLALLLRSIAVPLVGVVLNLLAVGATLGLMSLLFGGSSPILGGPGRLDAVALTAVLGVMFALSIDYQVFIVARVREEFLRTGDATRAVTAGLSRTAHVVTGAALSMLGVFIAFGLTDVASLRQFGVGLAIAIALDATIVRLVLLPAALRLMGKWAWWVPGIAHPARIGETRRPAPARA